MKWRHLQSAVPDLVDEEDRMRCVVTGLPHEDAGATVVIRNVALEGAESHTVTVVHNTRSRAGSTDDGELTAVSDGKGDSLESIVPDGRKPCGRYGHGGRSCHRT